MIQKLYEVYCDYCGNCLNHYMGRKPTRQELINDGFFCTATKQFCNEMCWGDYNHDLQQTRYLNIRTDGKIHNN